MSKEFEFCIPTKGAKVPQTPEWLHEIKYDGYRLRVERNGDLAQGTQASLAAKNATTALPIVFVLPGDPVGSGLVASLAQPGGNVTGLSSQVPELAGKRLDLLREIVPGLRRLAIMANVSNAANVQDTREVQAAARAGGLDVASFEIRRTADIAAAFAAFKRSSASKRCWI
jgi:putative ABC transport system substrate-binding protein